MMPGKIKIKIKRLLRAMGKVNTIICLGILPTHWFLTLI
jgi:hypothetical protein